MDFILMLIAMFLIFAIGIVLKLIKVEKKIKRFDELGIYENGDMAYSEGMQGDTKGGVVSDKRISTSHIKSLIGMT